MSVVGRVTLWWRGGWLTRGLGACTATSSTTSSWPRLLPDECDSVLVVSQKGMSSTSKDTTWFSDSEFALRKELSRTSLDLVGVPLSKSSKVNKLGSK